MEEMNSALWQGGIGLEECLAAKRRKRSQKEEGHDICLWVYFLLSTINHGLSTSSRVCGEVVCL